jgi:hypothetical protein
MLYDQMRLAGPRHGKIFGKVLGRVTDTEDPEKRGRVQVLVPAVFEEPVWAEPCLPYGYFFVPPVDSRVWVEFELGEIERPIWVGVWPDKDHMPKAYQSAKDRVIETEQGFTVEIHDDGLVVKVDDKNQIQIQKGKVIITGEAIEAVKGQ